VKIRSGPAAVTGYLPRDATVSLVKRDGKARRVKHAGSQKTCLQQIKEKPSRTGELWKYAPDTGTSLNREIRGFFLIGSASFLE